jgi:hypothetical protein
VTVRTVEGHLTHVFYKLGSKPGPRYRPHWQRPPAQSASSPTRRVRRAKPGCGEATIGKN